VPALPFNEVSFVAPSYTTHPAYHFRGGKKTRRPLLQPTEPTSHRHAATPYLSSTGLAGDEGAGAGAGWGPAAGGTSHRAERGLIHDTAPSLGGRETTAPAELKWSPWATGGVGCSQVGPLRAVSAYLCHLVF